MSELVDKKKLKAGPHNPADFQRWELREGNKTTAYCGLKGERAGTIHKSAGYNKFEEEPLELPEECTLRAVSSSYVYEFYTGKRELIKAAPDPLHAEHKVYFIHDNGGRPFCVFVDEANNGVYIYRIPEDGYRSEEWEKDIKDHIGWYQELVKQYPATERVFIGKWIERETDERFIGNSILVKIGGDEGGNRYLYIGAEIYEFDAVEEITQYHSLVGNNDVPYPVCVSANYVYFMLDEVAVHKRLLDLTADWYTKGPSAGTWENAYRGFYTGNIPNDENISFGNVTQVVARSF